MGRRSKRYRQPESSAEEKKETPEKAPEAIPASVDVHSSDDDDDDDSYGGLEDPFTYSDDSASLSDAYFFPQSDDDLARPPRYREQDPLGQHGYTNVNYYGSIMHSSDQRANSPLWVGGAIQEDSVVAADLETKPFVDGNSAAVSSRNERRRQRRRHREAQKMRMKQRDRERAVVLVRGQIQDPNKWHHVFFAVVFVMQLVLVLICALVFGLGLVKFKSGAINWNGNYHWPRTNIEITHDDTIGASEYTDDHTTTGALATTAYTSQQFFTFDYQNVVSLVAITGLYACVLTYISFGFMLILARALVLVVLVFSVLVALAWGLIGLSVDPYGVISVMGFAALLLTLGYTMYNWNRIPFAATNLYTSLCAMRCTADITILGMASLLVAFGWCMVWSMAFVGIVNLFNNLDCDQKDACDPHVAVRHLPIYLMFIGSFYWTSTVIKNVVQVTVARAIGTWWFHPHEIRPFCTSAVLRPLLHALTTNLGSICLGSLIVNFAQLFAFLGDCCCCMIGNSDCMYQRKSSPEQLESQRRKSSSEQLESQRVVTEVDSAADSVGLGRRICNLLNRARRYVRACNRWTFTYIGLYNYEFREGGEKAIQLFETREWLDVVRDNLILNVLVMASIVIGGSAGTFAVVVEETDGYYFSSFHMPTLYAFFIGSMLGYVLSSILLLGVVGSAVNTVLVCFAAGPFEFDKNHQRLSREMREVWSQQVWEPAA